MDGKVRPSPSYPKAIVHSVFFPLIFSDVPRAKPPLHSPSPQRHAKNDAALPPPLVKPDDRSVQRLSSQILYFLSSLSRGITRMTLPFSLLRDREARGDLSFPPNFP